MGSGPLAEEYRFGFRIDDFAEELYLALRNLFFFCRVYLPTERREAGAYRTQVWVAGKLQPPSGVTAYNILDYPPTTLIFFVGAGANLLRHGW